MTDKINSELLDDIVQAFVDASGFVIGQTLDTFRTDKLVGYATVRALLIVGEASKGIPAETRSRFPEIPWQLMADMRNRLVHNYNETPWEIVWNVTTVEIPKLIDNAKRIRDQLEAEEAQHQTGTPE